MLTGVVVNLEYTVLTQNQTILYLKIILEIEKYKK